MRETILRYAQGSRPTAHVPAPRRRCVRANGRGAPGALLLLTSDAARRVLRTRPSGTAGGACGASSTPGATRCGALREAPPALRVVPGHEIPLPPRQPPAGHRRQRPVLEPRGLRLRPEEARAADGVDLPVLRPRGEVVRQRRQQAEHLAPEAEAGRAPGVERRGPPVVQVQLADQVPGAHHGPVREHEPLATVADQAHPKNVPAFPDRPDAVRPLEPPLQDVQPARHRDGILSRTERTLPSMDEGASRRSSIFITVETRRAPRAKHASWISGTSRRSASRSPSTTVCIAFSS